MNLEKENIGSSNESLERRPDVAIPSAEVREESIVERQKPEEASVIPSDILDVEVKDSSVSDTGASLIEINKKGAEIDPVSNAGVLYQQYEGLGNTDAASARRAVIELQKLKI